MKLEHLCSDVVMLPNEIRKNLEKLCETMSRFELRYGAPLWVTSGYRTPQEHARIYEEINDRRLLAGLDEFPIPLHSKHLIGRAVDVSDPELHLQYWILDHLDVLEDLDLYMERFEFTTHWCHFQDIPPRSGRRFFVP